MIIMVFESSAVFRAGLQALQRNATTSRLPTMRRDLDGSIKRESLFDVLDNAFAALSAGVSEVRITRSDALGAGEGTSVRL